MINIPVDFIILLIVFSHTVKCIYNPNVQSFGQMPEHFSYFVKCLRATGILQNAQITDLTHCL